MERLTQKIERNNGDVEYHPTLCGNWNCGGGLDCNIIGKYQCIEPILARLGEYEDIDLTPSEVLTLKREWQKE